MKGSIIIFLCFLAGILAGQININWSEVPVDKLMEGTLYLLMLLVGLNFGSDPRFREIIAAVNLKLLLIPLTTIAGTFLGIIVYNRFFNYIGTTDAMAVAAGFGYYSLSSILIEKYSGSDIAVIALLANISREIITLLLTPFMVKYFGKLAPIASGGATSMDTSLAVIVRSSGKNYLLVSLFNGVLLTILVPFIISFLYR